MKIQDLRSAKGARRADRRKGRGVGSGRGKTSGHGHKGAKARSGPTRLRFKEGGQMPLMRRAPKVGFTSRDKKEYSIVNLEKLNIFDKGSNVTPQLLKEKGIIRNLKLPVKILGKGRLKHGLNVSAHAFSKTAKSAIEQAGGKAGIAVKEETKG